MHDYSVPTLIRALGRGKKGTRDLTRNEAAFIMRCLFDGSITGPQLGAFLMLMRVKEETAEELAGMIDASMTAINYKTTRSIDVCWPAYAGKKRQPSWYLLAAKLLAKNGVSVLIHGAGEHTEGRQYAVNVSDQIGIKRAQSLAEAEAVIQEDCISYLALSDFSPRLSSLIDMKSELGLRSPVNTLVRHLNPLNATLTLQGMFHPSYMALHHQTAQLLNQNNNIVLKGDGGEFEVRPDSKTSISLWHQQKETFDAIEPVLKQRSIRPDRVDILPLLRLWDGTEENDYGQQAVIQTASLVLAQLNNLSIVDARQTVHDWWRNR